MSVPSKNLLKTLFLAGIAAVKPDKLINSILKVDRDQVIVGSRKYDISDGKCYMVGFGKAVADMALQAESILGDKLHKGVLSVPEGLVLSSTRSSKIKVLTGGRNNIPDENSLKATEEIIKVAREAGEKDLVLVMISGGGSALLSKPKSGISLEEKVNLIKTLAKAGADIKELNCVRKRISLVKGGKLSQFIHPARSISFILSDIVGDPLDLISSGPTVKNTEPSSKALEILQKYKLTTQQYNNVKEIIQHDDDLDDNIFKSVDNIILGNNRIALDAVNKKATAEGYSTVILSSSVEKNVEVLSGLYAQLMHSSINFKSEGLGNIDHILNELGVKENMNTVKDVISSQTKKICFLLGGETVVNVLGKGVGGRNQELALRVSMKMENLSDESIKSDSLLFLSGGTDGIDGPTDAAGAFTYPGQLTQAKQENLNAQIYLENNDSYNYFKQFNNGSDLLITGHTGVNVMDLHIILIHR